MTLYTFHNLQIYAGGDIDGIEMLQDEPKRIQDDSSWLLKPGAEIKKVCDSPTDTFSFEGDFILFLFFLIYSGKKKITDDCDNSTLDF